MRIRSLIRAGTVANKTASFYLCFITMLQLQAFPIQAICCLKSNISDMNITFYVKTALQALTLYQEYLLGESSDKLLIVSPPHNLHQCLPMYLSDITPRPSCACTAPPRSSPRPPPPSCSCLVLTKHYKPCERPKPRSTNNIPSLLDIDFSFAGCDSTAGQWRALPQFNVATSPLPRNVNSNSTNLICDQVK